MNDKQTIRRLVSGSLGEKKKIYRELLKKACQKGIYFALPPTGVKKASLLNKKKIELTMASYNQIKKLLSNKVKGKKEQLVFTFNRAELGKNSLPPYGLIALVLKAALDSSYQDPIYIQVDLELDPAKYQHTVKKEVNIVKKQIKNCRKAGCLNFCINFSALKPPLSKEISGNLKCFVDFLETRTQKKLRPVETDSKIPTKEQKIRLICT